MKTARKCSFCGKDMSDVDPGRVSSGRLQCLTCYAQSKEAYPETVDTQSKEAYPETVDIPSKGPQIPPMEAIKKLIFSAVPSTFESNSHTGERRFYWDKAEIILFNVINKGAWAIMNLNNGHLYLKSEEQKWIGHACFSDEFYQWIDYHRLHELANENDSVPEFVFQINSENWREVLKEDIQERHNNQLRRKAYFANQPTVTDIKYGDNTAIQSIYISIISSDRRTEGVAYLRMTDAGYRLFIVDFTSGSYQYGSLYLSFPITEEEIDGFFARGIGNHHDVFEKTLTEADVACIYQFMLSCGKHASTSYIVQMVQMSIGSEQFTEEDLDPAFVMDLFELFKGIVLHGAVLKQ